MHFNDHFDWNKCLDSNTYCTTFHMMINDFTFNRRSILGNSWNTGVKLIVVFVQTNNIIYYLSISSVTKLISTFTQDKPK
jgi:hypothetical protein